MTLGCVLCASSGNDDGDEGGGGGDDHAEGDADEDNSGEEILRDLADDESFQIALYNSGFTDTPPGEDGNDDDDHIDKEDNDEDGNDDDDHTEGGADGGSSGSEILRDLADDECFQLALYNSTLIDTPPGYETHDGDNDEDGNNDDDHINTIPEEGEGVVANAAGREIQRARASSLPATRPRVSRSLE